MTYELSHYVAALDGFTYDDTEQRLLEPGVDTGFIVGYKGISFDNWSSLNNLVRMGIILAFSAVYEGKIIGGWHDKDTNTYYLDLCEIRAFKRDAMAFARDSHQKAIFCLHRNEVLSVAEAA